MIGKKSHRLIKKMTIWFTGMPSAGKSTVAKQLSKYLNDIDIPNIVLDGDEVRPIIADGVDYSNSGRKQTTPKYLKLCQIIFKSNIIPIVAVNQHTQSSREASRNFFPVGEFCEVWIDTPLEICMKRDVKGLFDKAKRGIVKNLVGHSLEYETPKSYDIRISTVDENVEDSAKRIIKFLYENNNIKAI